MFEDGFMRDALLLDNQPAGCRRVETRDPWVWIRHQGVWAPGDRIPSEQALAEELGIARLTARRAIRELVSRGLAKTLPGKGSFVVEQS
jgi:hypothetical protein